MDERARIPVTLPVPSPTPSYWHDPPSRLAAHTSGTLPSTTDTLIIGSGITGAAIAHFLLSSACPPEITMLEARTVTSGATGRNGGHTKAASYRSFLHHAEVLGTQAACAIARLELSNIRAVHAFAAAHAPDAESRPCRTVDAIYDPEQWAAAKEAVQAMRDAMPGDDTSDYEFHDAEEMRERFHVHGEGLRGGIGYEAGSISAYRFTTGVLESCLAKGMRLFTQTPALELRKQVGEHRWLVDTPKGTVAARRVVLATNGYTAFLHQRFQGAIVPLRGQVTAHRPGSNMPPSGLDTTYSFIYEGGYEYMIPRPPGTAFAGDIVIGGGLARAVDGGLNECGTTDDSQLNGDISPYLHETTSRYFGPGWGVDDPAGRVRAEWTGIMGFSPDGFPFVGPVPEEEELWVCAAFQGHGMVMCWMCGKALAAMLEGRDGEELKSWFPDAFRVTGERLGSRFKGRLNHTTATARSAGAA
ncbi:FAD dependent oxidoreductase [Colletotrichum plurivorum]|uniref:FAD dependent oxidoreductase n=1 Tax=Colletotrichum plurivorum TaxID=2175906 RepID=A0A8H6NAD6_9PEZI|nr:FAD dependent oxidoreductase [Colletotrichum plurivorum]